MADMQAVLMAVGTVHASGRHARAHAASGKQPAGEDFFQALSARIESDLSAGGVTGKDIDIGRAKTDGEPSDGARLADILDAQARVGLDDDPSGQDASSAPTQGQDQLMPVLAMLWAAGEVSTQEASMPDAVSSAGVEAVDMPPTSSPRVQTASKDAQARQGDAQNKPDVTAEVAANGQVLPPAVGANTAAVGDERADLPVDARITSPEARLAMQEALSSQSTRQPAGDNAATPLVATLPDASRELLAQRMIDPATRGATEVSVPSTLQAPLRSPAFASEFGDRLVWMANRHVQSAELTLNPPQLGTVEVRLTLHGSEAGAQFYSANPQVREALDQALSKLREIMAGAGITLGQASVSDQGFARQDQAARGQKAVTAISADESLAMQGGTQPLRTGVGLGLVDLFA